MLSTILLQATAGADGAQAGNQWSFWIMMILIFVVFYFFMIRPQQKKQKEIRNFQNSLQEGAKVVTGGGVYGTVKHIDLATNIIELEIARGVVIRVDRNYVFADVTATNTPVK